MKINVFINQFPISLNLRNNLNTIVSIINQSQEEELIILPEGALSGYSDNIEFLKNINHDELLEAMNIIKDMVMKKRAHIIFGTCIKEDDIWYNKAICYSYNNPDFAYKKVNLAVHERMVFQEGDSLPICVLNIMNNEVRIGIQMCRELRYPEQWRFMAMDKAQLFVHLNNAIVGNALPVWKSQLISRAIENQRFVISCNNAHSNQQSPTMLISPKGSVIKEILSEKYDSFREEIDLNEISDFYINQSRFDIIDMVKRF